MYGELRNATFLVKLHQLIQALMNLESRFVVLPYPDCALTTKCWPFVNDISISSSILRAYQYVDKILVKEGMPTIVKVWETILVRKWPTSILLWMYLEPNVKPFPFNFIFSYHVWGCFFISTWFLSSKVNHNRMACSMLPTLLLLWMGGGQLWWFKNCWRSLVMF